MNDLSIHRNRTDGIQARKWLLRAGLLLTFWLATLPAQGLLQNPAFEEGTAGEPPPGWEVPSNPQSEGFAVENAGFVPFREWLTG